MSEVSVPISDMLSKLMLTVKLTGVKPALIRLAIAKWIFKLGYRVSGAKGWRIEVS